MRCSVLYIDHTATGKQRRAALVKTRASAAAIAAGFAKGIKHIKQLVPTFFRDAGAVIRYADADDTLLLRRGEKLDAGMFGGIFDGVVDEVHQHLLDQLGVHIGHQQVIRHVGHNGVAGGVMV